MNATPRVPAFGHPPRSLIAGIDIGGTKAAVLVVDRDGMVVSRAVRPMFRADGPSGTAPILEAVRAALDAAGAGPASLAAIGIGVPGRVDREAGVVTVAANLGWNGLRLAAVVESQFGVPCRIDNDVRLAAAGLADHPLAKGARSLAYVAVGTGIGAGLVLDGVLHRGPRGTAGEIGHVIVEPDGSACSCGQSGCLETVSSGPAVLRQAEEALAGDTASTLRFVEPRSAKTVYDAARTGDALALRITERAGRALAHAIAGLVLTCDLECVLIGGGVAAAGEAFLDPILAELDRLRAQSPLIEQLVRPGSVRLLPAQFDAVAWGGIAVARRMSASAASPIFDELESHDERIANRDALVEEVVTRETSS